MKWLQRDLAARASDVSGLLGRHVSQVRQKLRKLVVGRLECTPFDDGRERGYCFTGQGTYGRLLSGEALITSSVTPAGSARFRLTVPLSTVYRQAA